MAVKKKSGLGLLPKLLVGILIPILVAFLIVWAMVFFSVDLGKFRITSVKDIGSESLKELTTTSLKESKSSLDKLGEKIIREKAIDVAAQIEIFIKTHPKMKKEDILKDPWLKSIAVQKVGETGYTAVHDDQGINYFHANPKIVGTDLHDLSKPLPAFWKILEASLKGPASGYYDWKDADGRIRPKYMYLSPVKDTDLIVAATTYIDEFSRPARAMEGRMKKIETSYLEEYQSRIKIFYLVILCVVLVLLVRIYFYARSVIRPIRHLSEVADKISMGELNTRIQIKEKGEVGVLAESIERMQTSVKAAIERLQKRREAKI
jgi:nitrogen fixation/metabolism regulation signal transduction histidine kinase